MNRMTPKEIYSLISKTVYGQDTAKRAVAVAIANRFRLMRIPEKDRAGVKKSNILLKGPTGTGKSAIVRALRNELKIPVLEYDITQFSETGYVGRDVTDIAVDLANLVNTVKLPQWFLDPTESSASEESSAQYEYVSDKIIAKHMPWFVDVMRYMIIVIRTYNGSETDSLKEGLSQETLKEFLEDIKLPMKYLQLLVKKTDYLSVEAFTQNGFIESRLAPATAEEVEEISVFFAFLGAVLEGMRNGTLPTQLKWKEIDELVTNSETEVDFSIDNIQIYFPGMKIFYDCYMTQMRNDPKSFLVEKSGGLLDQPFVYPQPNRMKATNRAFEAAAGMLHRSLIIGVLVRLEKDVAVSPALCKRIFDMPLPGKDYSAKDVIFKAQRNGEDFEGFTYLVGIIEEGWKRLVSSRTLIVSAETIFQKEVQNVLGDYPKDIPQYGAVPLTAMGINSLTTLRRIVSGATLSNIETLRRIMPNTAYVETEARVYGSIYHDVGQRDSTEDLRRQMKQSAWNNRDEGESGDKVASRRFVENYAVVFIDEIDKLCDNDSSGSKVSREGVQRGLLKLIEGGPFSVTRLQAGRGEVFEIDTTNVLFITAGAFTDPTADLMPELRGRLPIEARLHPLDADALKEVLKLENSVLHGYRKLLEVDGIKVNIDESTYDYVAEVCAKENEGEDLGARRLDRIVEGIFNDGFFSPEKYLEHGYDLSRDAIIKRNTGR